MLKYAQKSCGIALLSTGVNVSARKGGSMLKHRCVKTGVDEAQARELFKGIKNKAPLRVGRNAIYYVGSTHELWYGPLKWGTCAFAKTDQDCKRRGCKGGIDGGIAYPSDSDEYGRGTCASFSGELLVAHLTLEELAVYLL